LKYTVRMGSDAMIRMLSFIDWLSHSKVDGKGGGIHRQWTHNLTLGKQAKIISVKLLTLNHFSVDCTEYWYNYIVNGCNHL
jgi:hypothetical protein